MKYDGRTIAREKLNINLGMYISTTAWIYILYLGTRKGYPMRMSNCAIIFMLSFQCIKNDLPMMPSFELDQQQNTYFSI